MDETLFSIPLFPAVDVTVDPAGIRDRIADWLATAPIQTMEGVGRGGIAGRLDQDNRPEYLYGEITGYWLRWASLYMPDADRMGAAVDFLAREWSGPEPAATRAGAGDDWRNRAVFSFDLAMMVQGLADAAPIAGQDRCATAAAPLLQWLDRLVGDDGTLSSHLPLATGALPERWSTRPGPYQAKTAAALLGLPAGWLTHSLTQAATRTLDLHRTTAADHTELHPRCYALEGALRGGAEFDPRLLTGVCATDGSLPESLTPDAQSPRADVQAQVLRLLCVHPDELPTQVDSLVIALTRHVRTDGAVAFRVGDLFANVWCAMFAHQALDWLCQRRAGAFPCIADVI